MFKVLATTGELVDIFEPDHLGNVGIGKNGMHPFFSPPPDQAYVKLFDKIFHGNPYYFAKAKRSYLKYCRDRLLSKSSTRLIKSVYCLPNIEWIYERYQPRVILLLRNPCSVIHSIFRKFPRATLGQLDRKFLLQFRINAECVPLDNTTPPHDAMASIIGAYYSMVSLLAQKYPQFIIITHEKLCQDPVKQFKCLFDRIGLKWSDNVEEFILASNKKKDNDSIQHTCRLAEQEINKWQTLLTAEQIMQIRNGYHAFNCEFYKKF